MLVFCVVGLRARCKPFSTGQGARCTRQGAMQCYPKPLCKASPFLAWAMNRLFEICTIPALTRCAGQTKRRAGACLLRWSFVLSRLFWLLFVAMTKSNIYPVILVNKNSGIIGYCDFTLITTYFFLNLATRGGVGVLHVVGGVGAELN